MKPMYNHLEDISGIDSVRIRAGGAMEFDPRKGEVMVPDCVEFTITKKSNRILKLLSGICDKYDRRVILPEFKQPNFTYRNYEGEKRVHNNDVDYVAFVRLVEDR